MDAVSNLAYMDRCIMQFMREFPLTVTYIKESSSYSDSTGENTVTEVLISCQGILLEVEAKPSFGDGTKNNTLIRDGDKLLFIRPPQKTDSTNLVLDVNPSSDKILIGTTRYNIVTFKTTNPTASNSFLYEFYIRT